MLRVGFLGHISVNIPSHDIFPFSFFCCRRCCCAPSVKDWAIGQTEHSANYGGRIASFFTGGLNLQIEHHLFPAMAYKHYLSISTIVREECKKHNVQYSAFATLPPIIASFVNYMRITGSKKENRSSK